MTRADIVRLNRFATIVSDALEIRGLQELGMVMNRTARDVP